MDSNNDVLTDSVFVVNQDDTIDNSPPSPSSLEHLDIDALSTRVSVIKQLHDSVLFNTLKQKADAATISTPDDATNDEAADDAADTVPEAVPDAVPDDADDEAVDDADDEAADEAADDVPDEAADVSSTDEAADDATNEAADSATDSDDNKEEQIIRPVGFITIIFFSLFFFIFTGFMMCGLYKDGENEYDSETDSDNDNEISSVISIYEMIWDYTKSIFAHNFETGEEWEGYDW